MNTILGMLVFALGGLAGATFSLPFRKVKGVAYESYWLVYAVAGLILFPLALGLATVPGLMGVIGDTPAKTLLACAGFGAMWGIGGLTWGLMIRYLGVGLGLAIGCGLCSATGTLLPPIFKGEAATLVLGADGAVSLAKVITLVGVALSLAGIVFVGLAGKSKEGELDEEAKKAAVAEFNFKKGIIVALVSGVFSGCMNFGLSSGDVMSKLAEASGAGKWWTGVPVLIVVLWGGFAVNAAYCLVMNKKNGTFGDYGKLFKGAGLSALLLSAFAGVIWALQFAFLKMGEPLCGDLAYVGFAVVMGASVMFSSLLGVMLGEWKGVGANTKKFLATGLVLLAVSIVMPIVSKAFEKEAPKAPKEAAPVVEKEAPKDAAPAVEKETPKETVPAVEKEAPKDAAPAVEKEAPKAAEPVVEKEATVSLFNGKDLNGWTAFLDKAKIGDYTATEETWAVVDGAIRTTGTPFGYLRTERKDFGDFTLRLEYRWWRKTPKPNSGVFIRFAKESGRFIPRCYENQLCPDGVCSIFALGGSVLEGVAPRNPYNPANPLSGIAAVPAKATPPPDKKTFEKPFGEWNELVLTVKGDEVVSVLNGVEMNRVKGVKTPKGAIALQAEGGAAEFRNITIKE